MTTDPQKLVVVGMSGGVDSSVACFLLLEQGYTVIGVSLLTADNGQQAMEDAAAICRQLKIEHVILDIRQEFRQLIIADFVKAWLAGLTPNPCVSCNQQIKFFWLSQYAAKRGATYVATGHYATVRRQEGRLGLVRTSGDQKDQTYFLYRLSQEQLSRLIFPLAGQNKQEVRRLAQATGLLDSRGEAVADLPDSQDICFIDTSYLDFLKQEISATGPASARKFLAEGDVVNQAGELIGRHKGLLAYTLGQRKGFEVKTTERLFVLERDFANNCLVVGPHAALAKEKITVSDLVYSGTAHFTAGQQVQAKVRSSARLADCQVWPAGPDRLEVTFDQPVMGPTPGQSCVFYSSQDLILAGGVIEMPPA